MGTRHIPDSTRRQLHSCERAPLRSCSDGLPGRRLPTGAWHRRRVTRHIENAVPFLRVTRERLCRQRGRFPNGSFCVSAGRIADGQPRFPAASRAFLPACTLSVRLTQPGGTVCKAMIIRNASKRTGCPLCPPYPDAAPAEVLSRTRRRTGSRRAPACRRRPTSAAARRNSPHRRAGWRFRRGTSHRASGFRDRAR